MREVNETSDSEVLAEEEAANQKAVDRGFWRKVKRTAGKIPFSEDAVAAYYCARDSETPGRVRAVLLAALAYFVTPADLIPDFIAAFGFTDDATVLTAAIATISGYIKPRHVARARLTLEKDLPANDA